MKNQPINIPKSKKVDLQNKKKNALIIDNDNKKKINTSPQKSDIKKETLKNDKYNNQNNQQNLDSKGNKFINNINIKNISIVQNNININSLKNEKNKIKISDIPIPQSAPNNNKQNNNDSINLKSNPPLPINNDFINEKNNGIKLDNNIKNSSPLENNIILNHISYSENMDNKINENDIKLQKSLQAYKNINKKNDSTSLNTLYKLRSILLNLLKDKEQDLEYSKFMTEKKLKFLIKNKEKSENRIKEIESELKIIDKRKEELEQNLGEIYCFYDEDELKEDIKRFENSNEVKSGKFSKTLEQLETMKKMLPFVSEYGKIKDKQKKILNEKKELEKFIKNSGQTISTLNNYYKNIKKKINE